MADPVDRDRPAEGERPSRPHRHHRGEDPDSDFVSHVRAADTGIQIGSRMLQTIVLFIGFGITIGGGWQRFNTLSEKVEAVGKRLDDVGKQANDASVDSKVARQLEEDAKQKREVQQMEMDQWRATFRAIAMIQQQGGGKVTLQIPERGKQQPKGD